MDDHGALCGEVVDGSDASQEVEEGRGMPGHAKVRPGDEVVLAHVPRLFRVHLTQTQHNYNYNIIFTVKMKSTKVQTSPI